MPNPDRQELRLVFERGLRLAAAGQLVEALDCFGGCLAAQPGNAVYVEVLISHLRSEPARRLKQVGRLWGFVRKRPFRRAVQRGNWSAVLELGPGLLAANLVDSETLRGLARACEASGHDACERLYLRFALELAPNDPDVNRHCAQALGRRGQFEEAAMLWQRVLELLPGDAEAAARHQPDAQARESESDGDGERPSLARRASVTGIEPHLELADQRVRERRFAEAEQILASAMAICGRHLGLLERLEEVRMAAADHRLSLAEEQAVLEPTPAARELVEQLRHDRNRLELQVFDARSQRHPDDLDLKFQLALRLKAVKNYREAVRHLEEIQARSGGTATLVELGECLQHLRQFPKALACYEQALHSPCSRSRETSGLVDDSRSLTTSTTATDDRPLVLYRAAVLAAAMERTEQARGWFEELTWREPGYKDAAARLDKLREIGHKLTSQTELNVESRS